MSFMNDWQRGLVSSNCGEMCHAESPTLAWLRDTAKVHGVDLEWKDFPPDPCRYPNCSCRFGYQEEGADNCPERRKS